MFTHRGKQEAPVEELLNRGLETLLRKQNVLSGKKKHVTQKIQKHFGCANNVSKFAQGLPESS